MGKESAPNPPENSRKSVYEEIVWVPTSPLKDENLWERNKLFVKSLMGMKGVDVLEIKDRTGCAKNLPTKYKIEDLVVDYQPNWNFYQVNLETAGTLFSLPKDADVPPERCVSIMLDDINYIKKRARRLKK